MDNFYNAETGCCPRFDPEPWDDKELQWSDRIFIKDRVRSFLHIPLNFGKVILRNMEKITAARAATPQPLMLSDENSLWGSDIYIETTKNIPDSQMIRISGTFLSRVFEGPYQYTGKWAKQVTEEVASKGKELKKMYFFYTTCPKCAKHYGKNYVVILAQI